MRYIIWKDTTELGQWYGRPWLVAPLSKGYDNVTYAFPSWQDAMNYVNKCLYNHWSQHGR